MTNYYKRLEDNNSFRKTVGRLYPREEFLRIERSNISEHIKDILKMLDLPDDKNTNI